MTRSYSLGYSIRPVTKGFLGADSNRSRQELEYNFKEGGTAKIPGPLPFVDKPVFFTVVP